MDRILMTADAVGGVWTYTLELARAFARAGVATTLATMGPPPSSGQRLAAREIRELELIERDFPLEWMDAWAGVDDAAEWLLDIETRIQPAIVHLNGYAHACLPWRTPTIVVAHSCVLSWSDAVRCPLDEARRASYHGAVSRGLETANWVVAPSMAMLAALERHYGPLPRATVIANGRDADRFQPLGKEPFVFAAGRIWDRGKNLDTLAIVAKQIRWPLVVAGEGAPPKGVAHVGVLTESQMAHWLGRAAIVAAPSRYEPFGLFALEAALSGCALVLGDIPSFREIWGAAADFVDPEDPIALRIALERLMTAPATLRDRASAARARALTFSPDRMARSYLDVYAAAQAAARAEQVSCGS
jgi:glycogen(starch) synthase